MLFVDGRRGNKRDDKEVAHDNYHGDRKET